MVRIAVLMLISVFLLAHGVALAQGNNREGQTANAAVPPHTPDIEKPAGGLRIDSTGIVLTSGGALIVPAITGAAATDGPAAGPDLPPTPPGATMAPPEEAVP